MPKGHALLSASGASRWLNCPPSARLEEQFPKSTSEYAKEGTVAHSLAEITTRYNLGEITKEKFEAEKAALVATKDGAKFYNAEMQEYADDYANLIWNKLQEAKKRSPDAFVELEVKVDFSSWVPWGFGTADCVIVADDWMEIVDFKYGKGHRVEAANNPQMRLYALGSYNYYCALYDIENIRMTIFQPRISGAQSSDECSIAELLLWAEETVKPTAELAYIGEGEFNPSDEACLFCRAKNQCKARFNKNLSLFEDADDPLLITPEEAGEVLAKASDIKAWLSDLEDLVKSTLESGQEVKGWKIVEGRSNRKLGDEKKVVAALKKAGIKEALLYTRSLITLTQMEKDFGKKFIAETLGKPGEPNALISKPEGNPTLVPDSDKRPAFQPKEKIMKAFDDDYEE